LRSRVQPPLFFDVAVRAASPTRAEPPPPPPSAPPSVASASPGAPLLSRLLASSRSRASTPIFLASRALYLIQSPGTCHCGTPVFVPFLLSAPSRLRDEGAGRRVSGTDGRTGRASVEQSPGLGFLKSQPGSVLATTTAPCDQGGCCAASDGRSRSRSVEPV